MLFNPSCTPIICSPKFERFGFERQHLLVPLLAWKVLAPGRNARNVNLFQKTILKLIRAGVVHSSEIADHMALDPELVKFIIAAQLQPNGLLDKSFKLTSEAEEALDDGIIGGRELSMAYLFQEPWSGKLLPRIANALETIEPDKFDDKGFPTFLCSRGEGKYEKPFCLKATKLPDAPDTGAIFEALERAETARFNSLQVGGDWAESQVTFSRGYELLEERPIQVLAWCYVKKANNGEVPWLASDPFGYFPAADYMRELLNERLEKDQFLAGRVARLFNIEYGTSADLQATIEQNEEQLRLELLAEWPWLSGYPQLERYVGSLLRLSKANISNGDKCRSEDIESECITAQKVAECLIKILLKKYSGKQVCNLLNSNERYGKGNKDRKPLDWIARRTLYDNLEVTGLNKDESKALASVESWGLIRAIERQEGSLKSLLAGALLTSYCHSTHPFIALENRSPEWIRKLLDLADLRNKAGHASDDQLDKQQVFNQTQWLISWVKFFEKEI